MKKLLILFLLLSSITFTNAQVQKKGKPLTYNQKVLKKHLDYYTFKCYKSNDYFIPYGVTKAFDTGDNTYVYYHKGICFEVTYETGHYKGMLSKVIIPRTYYDKVAKECLQRETKKWLKGVNITKIIIPYHIYGL